VGLDHRELHEDAVQLYGTFAIICGRDRMVTLGDGAAQDQHERDGQ
jgi:hypothetical protein